jgi:hypothetical protein
MVLFRVGERSIQGVLVVVWQSGQLEIRRPLQPSA